MSDFIEVGDERRRPPTKRGLGGSPLMDALRAGKTVIIPYRDGQDHHTEQMRASGSRTQNLRKQGFQLHTRMDPDGILMWAEPIK